MVKWYVWSSGREVWQPIVPSSSEIGTFVFQHAKTVNGRHVAVCLDETGRFVGGFHPVNDD